MASSRKRLHLPRTMLLLAVAAAVSIGAGVWYMRSQPAAALPPPDWTSLTANWRSDTASWRPYTNTCLHLTFKAPTDVTVYQNVPGADGTCVIHQGDTPTSPHTWQASAVQFGNHPIAALPQGVLISFSQLLPITDSAAMQVAGIGTGGTTPDVLSAFSAAMTSGRTTRTTIDGHAAVVNLVRKPDQAPSNYMTVDVPYCPCTTATVLIDAGQGTVLQASALWVNSDATTARISSEIIDSVSFQ